MLHDLLTGDKVVGVKQSRRAIRNGQSGKVFLASDADPALTEPLLEMCREKEIEVVLKFTMQELGQAAGIHVGASVVALLKNDL